MPVNYSKWDALELSDDSDFEPHPNVDKRSFIRAKQNQIHQQRAERHHHIETLKYERIVNEGLLQRIDTLLAALRSHEADAKNSDDFMMQALMECAGDPTQDEPPKPPPGVHSQSEQPRYSQMMASLVDQVKKEVGSKPDNGYKSYLEGVEGHKTKVIDLQKELMQKLEELELEASKKITSESIHTGFDSSSVNKSKPQEQGKPKASSKPKEELVEVLNPGALKKNNLRRLDSALSSGSEADVDEPVSSNTDPDEAHIEPTKLGKEFAKIKIGDYRACLQFISEHPEVVAERETDGLLIEAFNAQLDHNNSAYAKQCVHQALLLQYCRSLGRDGVGLFFKRITTKGHQAQKVFIDDVNTTYARILTRSIEIRKDRASNPSATQDVEQIQLHAVDPNTTITINIPHASSTDRVEIAAREIFERFPPGLQRALESGSLDRVNEVLGKMSVSEAEEVVEQLGEGGMLSLEEGVIDGTTEEGRERLRGLEEKAKEEAKEKGEEKGEKEGKEGKGNEEKEKGESAGRVEEIEVADPD